MDSYSLLKETEDLINRCVMCGGCHAGCPTYALTRYERDSARGKVLLAGALLKGEVDADASLAATFGHCLSCMNCIEACPAGADPVRVITAARAELFGKGGGGFFLKTLFRKWLPSATAFPLLAGGMRVLSRLYSALPPLDVLPFVRGGKKRTLPEFSSRRLRDIHPPVKVAGKPAMRVGYYLGCMTDGVFHDTGRAVMETLAAAGAEVVLVSGEVCCGAPAFFSGDREGAALSAMRNVEAFGAEKLDYIVTSCATCGSVLKDIYPQLLSGEGVKRFSAKVVDFQKLLFGELWGNISFDEGKPPLRVTYHDPCHLSRGMKVRSEPREILKAMPGVEFVEMEDASRCCGGAGAFAVKFYDSSLSIGEKKADSIRDTGADMVLTSCPSCRMQLSELDSRFGHGAEVRHTAFLVNERRRKD